MARVKTNEHIKDLQDVQNLVTGIIFRQLAPFSKSELEKAVERYMERSPVEDKKGIQEIIDNTLKTSISNDWLTYKQGKYIPAKVI